MFFSVKMPLKIGDKKYRTCICYELPENMRLTVEKLAQEGKAVIYEKEVFFCNGKLQKEVTSVIEYDASLAGDVPVEKEIQEETKADKKKAKKNSKREMSEDF